MQCNVKLGGWSHNMLALLCVITVCTAQGLMEMAAATSWECIVITIILPSHAVTYLTCLCPGFDGDAAATSPESACKHRRGSRPGYDPAAGGAWLAGLPSLRRLHRRQDGGAVCTSTRRPRRVTARHHRHCHAVQVRHTATTIRCDTCFVVLCQYSKFRVEWIVTSVFDSIQNHL